MWLCPSENPDFIKILSTLRGGRSYVCTAASCHQEILICFDLPPPPQSFFSVRSQDRNTAAEYEIVWEKEFSS